MSCLLLVAAGILLAVPFSGSLHSGWRRVFDAAFCGSDGEQQAKSPDHHWTATSYQIHCGLLGVGGSDVSYLVLHHPIWAAGEIDGYEYPGLSGSRGKVVLTDLNKEPLTPKWESDQSLVIEVSNEAVIAEQFAQFTTVSISLRYLPFDDPQRRSANRKLYFTAPVCDQGEQC